MIAAILPPFSLIAITGQSSYPLNSENASPFGTCTVYLSCAEMALKPKTASTTAIITINGLGLLCWSFRFVPKADIPRCGKEMPLFDHLVGAAARGGGGKVFSKIGTRRSAT